MGFGVERDEDDFVERPVAFDEVRVWVGGEERAAVGGERGGEGRDVALVAVWVMDAELCEGVERHGRPPMVVVAVSVQVCGRGGEGHCRGKWPIRSARFAGSGTRRIAAGGGWWVDAWRRGAAGFRALPRPLCGDVLAARLGAESLGLVAGQRGWRGAAAAGAGTRGGELLLLSAWADLEAVKSFAGVAWEVPVVPAGYGDLIEQSSVEHHRLLAVRCPPPPGRA